MSRDRMVPSATMPGGPRSVVPAALLAGLLALTGCADGQGSETRDTFAAVSPGEGEGTSEAAESDDEAQDATAGAGEATSGEQADGLMEVGPLDEDEIGELLLEEDELPFEPDSYLQETGAEYFHENIGVVGDTYVRGFGDAECAQQMDSINERLVGEAPQSGVIRQAAHQAGAREERLYLWMLSYQEPVDSGPIWDDVLDACEGERLEDGSDTIDFAAFAAGGFRGLSMDMGVDTGEEVVAMDGYSATRDLGSNLLMISAVNIDPATFDEILDAQSEKIEAQLGD